MKDLRTIAAARTADWPGTTGALAGATFGSLTVEAPARVDERGVHLLCRCACGRVAVRRVVELHRGEAVACRVCVPPVAPTKRRSPRPPRRVRNPEAWAREVRRARDIRRDLRAVDPGYREREAAYARAYRERKREPFSCACCGRTQARRDALRGPVKYCGDLCRSRARARQRATRRGQRRREAA